LKLFAQNKEDRKIIEKALDRSGLPSNKNDVVGADKLVFQDFFNFYTHLVQRKEVEAVFAKL
jgi:phosphatidylinositol phospholipase C beta